jgi:hypothetical protein
MGLFDFLAWDTTCPRCGDRRARKPLLGRVKCTNRDCANFDLDLMTQREEAGLRQPASAPAGPQRQYRNPRTGEMVAKEVRDHFDPGQAGIDVHYTNFRGEEKSFRGDRRTLRRRGNHLSLRLAPTGQRAAFARDRIHNLAELEEALRQVPTPREQWVLYFHSKRRSTSPLYERLRVKYPHWSPAYRAG